jgi:hypothetical protein
VFDFDGAHEYPRASTRSVKPGLLALFLPLQNGYATVAARLRSSSTMSVSSIRRHP